MTPQEFDHRGNVKWLADKISRAFAMALTAASTEPCAVIRMIGIAGSIW